MRGLIAAASAALLVALAPAGALACAPLAASHAPVCVSSSAPYTQAQRAVRAVAVALATFERTAASQCSAGARRPEVRAPWRGPSAPAPSTAPPARA